MIEQFDLLPFLPRGLINGSRSHTRMHFLWILLFSFSFSFIPSSLLTFMLQPGTYVVSSDLNQPT
jgi:hypothetical protein